MGSGESTGTIICTKRPNYFKLATIPWICPECNTTRRVRLYHKNYICRFCGNTEAVIESARLAAIEKWKKEPHYRYKKRIDKY